MLDIQLDLETLCKFLDRGLCLKRGGECSGKRTDLVCGRVPRGIQPRTRNGVHDRTEAAQ